MFPAALSSGQKTTLRTEGYNTRVYVCLNPNAIVFQAQAAQSITDNPFLQFTWDNATIGAYTDVLEGMVCFISSTTDLRLAKYRGRVRLAPDATTFYIDENATVLNDNDYITVIRDVDWVTRVRRGDLVDGSLAYHNLPPMISGLPSVLHLYDAANAGVMTYAFTQTGIPVADGATISSWLWTISGSGATSFTVGSSASQSPTIQFEVGYHYLVRCRVTDSNGIVHYQFVQVFVVDYTFSTLVYRALAPSTVDQDADNGFTGSITAYAQVDTLLDRTFASVWHVQHFGDNSSAPIVSNTLMFGRIRSDSIQTEGSTEAGQLQAVTFAVEGITAYMQRLRIPNDIIRAKASPAAWGEIKNPNPYRMAVYAMWVYTTVTRVCSFSAEDFSGWGIGNDPLSIEGGYALDVLKSILYDRIKAAPNFAPQGAIYLAQLVSYLADRSAVVTVLDFTLADMRSYTIERDSSKTCAQVIAYGGSYNSAAQTFDLYQAQSPSIVYGDAPEPLEVSRELLLTDSSIADASLELGSRAGNHYAFNNPKPMLRVIFYDSQAWLIATNFQRYTFTIPAGSNTLGIAYTLEEQWQCQSVSIGIGTDGSLEVTGEFVAETEFSDAQALAGLLPINLSGLNPVLPVLPNDPAFPTDPLELYPTDTPTDDELQPINAAGAAAGYTPFPPNVAADMAAAQGTTKCQSIPVYFRNPSNTPGTKLTTLSAAYNLSLNGSAKIADNSWTYYMPVAGLYPDFTFPPFSGAQTTVVAGEMVGATSTDTLATFLNAEIIITGDLTSITIYYEFEAPDAGAQAMRLFIDGVLSADKTIPTTPGSDNVTWIGSETGTNTYNILGGIQGSGGGHGIRVTMVVFRGINTNPFTSEPGADLFGDAFYQFPADDSIPAELYPADEGLRVDNGAVAVPPPYNPDHAYTVPFTGTGNLINLRMEYADYTDVQNVILYAKLCKI